MTTNQALVTILLDENEAWNDAILKVVPVVDKNGEEKRGVELPDPSSYSSTTSTMVDGGTSVSGKTLGSVVRNNVAEVSLSWNYLEAPNWAKINQLFKENHFRQVRFFDQAANEWDVREMSVSDRSGGMWRRDGDGNVLGWTGCSLQLTEV